jgi:hypothetical protein
VPCSALSDTELVVARRRFPSSFTPPRHFRRFSQLPLIDARPDHIAICATVAGSGGCSPSRESRFLPDYVRATEDYGPLQVNARWTPEIVGQTTAERITTAAKILAEAYRAYASWAGADRRYKTES